jgi:hypothetical protein
MPRRACGETGGVAAPQAPLVSALALGFLGWVAGKAVKGAILPGRRLLAPWAVASASPVRLPSPSVVGCVPQRGLRPLRPVGVKPSPPHPPSLRLRARGALRLRANSLRACWGLRPSALGGFPHRVRVGKPKTSPWRAALPLPVRANWKLEIAPPALCVAVGGDGGHQRLATTSTVHGSSLRCRFPPSVRPPVCWERFYGPRGLGYVRRRWLTFAPAFVVPYLKPTRPVTTRLPV